MGSTKNFLNNENKNFCPVFELGWETVHNTQDALYLPWSHRKTPTLLETIPQRDISQEAHLAMDTTL